MLNLHLFVSIRIHTATFLPFRAYNTDNQLITDTINVICHTDLNKI